MVGVPNQTQLDNVKQDTVQWDSKAHRVFLVDSNGITLQGSDGTNSFVTIRAKHSKPILLKSENNDVYIEQRE